MSKALGLIEFSSISQGIEVGDILLKAAFVEVEMLKHVCPGKFMIIISGDVEEVTEATEKVKDLNSKRLVETYVIANAHEALIEGLKKRPIINEYNAIGVMELTTIASSLVALDSALKSSSVKLVKVILGNGIGGKSYFIISGSVSSVEEGLKVASSIIDSKRIIHKVVIPSPSKLLLKNL